MNLFSLNDQVILVTGSSRGLGWEMAKAMAEAGATVILNGRDRELLSKRQTELEKAGLKSAIQAFDAANENEVLNGVQSIAEKHGQLDGLINNAGIQHRKPLQDFELSDYDRLMDVNLRGSFLLAREASKLMLEKSSGSIVNIASIMGPLGRKTISAYTTSKGGIVGLTKALAVELGPHIPASLLWCRSRRRSNRKRRFFWPFLKLNLTGESPVYGKHVAIDIGSSR